MARAPTPLPAARRVDAERNRERILDAARAAFADPDADVSMAEISRRAGVGSATLYRNFANRRECSTPAGRRCRCRQPGGEQHIPDRADGQATKVHAFGVGIRRQTRQQPGARITGGRRLPVGRQHQDERPSQLAHDICEQDRRRLVRQPGLPDPRLTRAQHQAAATRQGIVQQQRDPSQLAVTAHHRPRGPAPHTSHQATIKPAAIGALVVNSIECAVIQYQLHYCGPGACGDGASPGCPRPPDETAAIAGT